jgi:hypothetical protein
MMFILADGIGRSKYLQSGETLTKLIKRNQTKYRKPTGDS